MIKINNLLDKGKELLDFLNLLDHKKRLSISNAAVVICVIKIALAPQVSLVDAGALLVALLNYSHKRLEANKTAKEIKALEQSNTLQKDVDNIIQELQEVKELHDTVSKQAEDTRKALSNANITAAFGIRK